MTESTYTFLQPFCEINLRVETYLQWLPLDFNYLIFLINGLNFFWQLVVKQTKKIRKIWQSHMSRKTQ